MGKFQLLDSASPLSSGLNMFLDLEPEQEEQEIQPEPEVEVQQVKREEPEPVQEIKEVPKAKLVKNKVPIQEKLNQMGENPVANERPQVQQVSATKKPRPVQQSTVVNQPIQQVSATPQQQPIPTNQLALQKGQYLFILEEGRIGYDDDCEVQINISRYISGHHAKIKYLNGCLYIRDDNSTNGTFINGKRIKGTAMAKLCYGDSVRFGDTEFKIITI